MLVSLRCLAVDIPCMSLGDASSVLTPISFPGTGCSSGKLPKNYDPKVTPDPERWLPMRERSYYRGRKKGKKKDQVGKGTQGSTTTGSSEL